MSAIKVLVDGAIAGLHAHDGADLDNMAGRLARRLGDDPSRVRADLMDRSAAVLGTRRLLWPFRDYVQWNPADDGIVRLEVSSRPSHAWRVSGRLSAIPVADDGRTSVLAPAMVADN